MPEKPAPFGAFRAAQLARPAEVCGARYTWMQKRCTLEPGHPGSHCEERQCGDQVVKFWWSDLGSRA